MRRTKLRSEESEINVTPLLDVVFIMLIFFIVTASFIKETAIDIARSGAGASHVKSKGNIVVVIGPNENLWVNHRPVSVGALHANLKQQHAENPNAKVIVSAHPDSSNGLLVHVLDTSRLAGVPDVSLAAAD
ncbi:MAG: biopolymer transporter ExbD [Myxococcota bacterium]|nr:biopolymer transporter ExbD [Myxococcota bacterium]